MSKDLVLKPRLKRLALSSTCALLGMAVHMPAQGTILAARLSLASLGLVDNSCSQDSTFAPAANGSQSGQSSMSKSEAILGGSMSALDRIRAEQVGVQLAQPSMFSPAVDPAALDSIERPTRCATADLVVPTLSQPIVTPTIAGESGDDNFLATRRIAIARTSFSANWERVSTDGLSRDRVTALIGDRTNEGASQIQFVNRWVNHAIIYGEDRAVWGRRDYWATADQTLALRRGDCEDLAILKYQMLLALGVDPEAMYLTLARDLARNADHAVLIVRHGDRFFLLDNSTDAILPANLSYDYRPTLSFNGRSAWLHGAVARVRPQVVNAAERAPIPPLPVPALQGYRPVLATIALQEYRPL